MQDQNNSTKTEAAYQLLRRDILTTRLMPGAPLKLSALRGTYGVGWTPLREALSRLAAERLVTAISNRGFAVAPVSRAELEDLARARMVVEMPLFLESIANGGREWEDAVVTTHYRLSRCKTAVEDPSDAAVDKWDESHEAFHAADQERLRRFVAHAEPGGNGVRDVAMRLHGHDGVVGVVPALLVQVRNQLVERLGARAARVAVLEEKDGSAP